MDPPNVTREDVLRVVQREFPRDHVQALCLLDRFEWDVERERVQLAILKLSHGDLGAPSKELEHANEDYRDMLGPAEYWRSTRPWIIYGATASAEERAEREQAERDDYAEYQEWLHRK